MADLEGLRRALKGLPQVRLAYVFGSFARNEERQDSDLDIAVLMDPASAEPLTEVIDVLESCTQRTVHLVDLEQAPPLLLRGELEPTRGVLTEATVSQLRSLAGFRNVLVHDYADLDLGKVADGLKRLDDFDAFVADVELWLEAAGS
jgi:predicted nucleotidyltransferase